MYFMISAGHFLMFFIGLETASIPMAALVAFDKYRHHVYEGAPSTVTAYLSVISKGAAAFVLMTILYKVCAPISLHWKITTDCTPPTLSWLSL